MSEENDDYFLLLSPNTTHPDGESETNISSNVICTFLEINGTESIKSLFQDPNCFRHSFGWSVFFSFVYILILLCGLIGNSLVIFVVIWKPRMRTVTNLFILNLAVADLFVIVFCVPATLLANIFIPWILGKFMCSAVAYVQGVSIFSSVYSLVAVSIDRCRAIYRPMDIPRGLTKPQSLIFIAVIWLTAVLITLPWCYVFEIVHSPETHLLPYCHENWTNPSHAKLYYIFVNLLLCYFCPLCLIIILNSVIWKSVSSRPIPHNPSANSHTNAICHIDQMHRTTKLRVLKMLTGLTLAFFICWLPLYCVMSRLKLFGVPRDHNSWEMELIEISIPLAQILGSSNSCINPIVYAFLNKKFREILKTIFSSWPFCRKMGNRESRSVSWRRRSDGTHQVRLPETISNAGGLVDNRRDLTSVPRSRSRPTSGSRSRSSSSNWSSRGSGSAAASNPINSNNLPMRSSLSQQQIAKNLARSSGASGGGRHNSFYSNSGRGSRSSLSHNSRECMCTRF